MTAPIDCIPTLDYEIFGNGLGDVRRDVIEPAHRILDLCNTHGAKMTIFFEVAEYWAFERYDAPLRARLGYSPYEEMRKQAGDAIAHGHDVQLHLHPQWIDAAYEDNTWRLNTSWWRLADLPDGPKDRDGMASVAGMLHRGKNTLEEMLRPVKADYECICLRAGGFCAQPSQHIIAAMKELGLRGDSSVVKGYRKAVAATGVTLVDYTHITTEKTAWWTTGDELTAEGKPGEHVLELPVSSETRPYWTNLRWTTVRAAIRRRQSERLGCAARSEAKKFSSVPSLRAALQRALTSQAIMFDYCKLSSRDMLRRVQKHARRGGGPLVLIGHTKDFVNDMHFERFLARMREDGHTRFRTMSEVVQDMSDALTAQAGCEAAQPVPLQPAGAARIHDPESTA
ncbi:MAG TPA: hypothetical protein P5068_04420 [Sedimentisphaerales bacterium]|nr:hypothetical protein [Sedimentisphaerales bacterium]HRV46985.1 hypothetical protein [Sedimentisphaerales bacterium]